MIVKLCCKCKKVIPYPNTYCPKCKTIAEQEYQSNKRKWNRNYNKTRDPKYTKFYNSGEWRTLSEKFLSDEEYKCEECQKIKERDRKYKPKIATEAHHIDPIQTESGWERRLDYTNLKAVCHAHHNEQHNRF